MEYEGMVIRPPSEARSLLIQVTLGCSHNKCTFCSTYRQKPFRIRSMEEIKRDITESAEQYRQYVKRVFLCDGNALVMKMAHLREILGMIRDEFPLCERVGMYATAKDILRKTPEELAELRQLGLGIVYVGLESGSDEILRRVNKGMDSQTMIDGVLRARQAGIKTSVMVIAGLGGAELWEEHARESARVLNTMQPDYVGLLSLTVEPGTELEWQVRKGTFRLLRPQAVIGEMHLLLQNLELEDSFFSSVHISNYVSVRGQLPDEKERFLEEIAYYHERSKDLW